MSDLLQAAMNTPSQQEQLAQVQAILAAVVSQCGGVVTVDRKHFGRTFRIEVAQTPEGDMRISVSEPPLIQPVATMPKIERTSP